MVQRDFLTENQVIQGVENYLKQKGRTSHKRVICKADAKRRNTALIWQLNWKTKGKMETGILLKQRGT
mgnify:CR=1 FL=1